MEVSGYSIRVLLRVVHRSLNIMALTYCGVIYMEGGAPELLVAIFPNTQCVVTHVKTTFKTFVGGDSM
jgi:hypothetical protein